MKALSIYLTLFAFSFALMAQEVSCELIKLSSNSISSWSINNKAGYVEFASSDFAQADTCCFVLPANESFDLNLSNLSLSDADTFLYELQINHNPILIIRNAVGLGDASYSFYTGVKKPVARIIGGSVADISDVPWQVFFEAGAFMCGGSIISDRFILTAAHCTHNDRGVYTNAADMSIWVGMDDRNGVDGKEYQVKKYTVHQNYNSRNVEDDIAIIELYEAIDYPNAERVELISTLEVAAGATDPGVMAMVSGWGVTNAEEGSTSQYLNSVSLPIVSNSTAASAWGYYDNRTLFAGYRNGGKDACSGDSGGPLVVDIDGTKKLVGVVSWGSEDCNSYGAYTRVSEYLDWIEEYSGAVSGSGLVTPAGDEVVCLGTVSSQYVTTGISGAIYEWQISPASAGSGAFTGGSATVYWDAGFTGEAEIGVRVFYNGEYSEWSVRNVEVQNNTRIITDPNDTLVCQDEAISIGLDVEGENLSYTWCKRSPLSVVSTDSYLSFAKIDTLDAGDYYCVVSGICGDAQTLDFTIEVLPRTQITSYSEDVLALQGDDVILSMNAVGDNLTYQWFKELDSIPGATSTQLPLDSIDATDIARYHVEAYGTCSRSVSDYIYVYIDGQLNPGTDARQWPSISSSLFYVAINTNATYDLKAYDLNGRIIFSQSQLSYQSVIDASSWGEGLYIIELSTKSFVEAFKVIKQ